MPEEKNMLKELMNSIANSIDDAIILDIWQGDACVGVWTKKRKVAVSQQATRRKVAERTGCYEVRLKIGNTEIEIQGHHSMFHTQQEVIDFLKSNHSYKDVWRTIPTSKHRPLKEDHWFSLITTEKSYPCEDCLLVKIIDKKVWLKFRADFSMNQQPPAANTKGTLTITIGENDIVHVEWEDLNSIYPPYSQKLRLSDIEVLQESDVIAEIL
jgi:hypothetical protein